MRLRRILATALCLTIASAAFAQRNQLKVGDPAPGLDIEEWVKGKETTLEKNQVYVVEFWATWCGPCKVSIPHLSKLQKEYGDKGLTIIGVSDEESATVKNFVKSQGDKMDYTVAVDRRKSTNRAWMQAAKQNGIPCAFIVARDGTIAYIGHPMEMEDVLRRVMRGRFDPKLEAQAKPLLENARLNRKTRNWRMASVRYQEVIDLSPRVFADIALEYFEMQLVAIGEKEDAYRYARNELINRHFADDPGALQMLAEKIALDPDFEASDRNFEVAMSAADLALKLTGSNDPEALATKALVLYQTGDVRQALRLQEQAWMMALPKAKPELRRVLDTYQRAADRTAINDR